jgi:hypothetical protein
MSALKRIVDAVSPLGHVVWTGSAMVTLINHARLVPTNGFMLMAHMHFVQLGGTPTPSAATAMAAALGHAYATEKISPGCAQKRIDTDAIVQKLDSAATGGLLSARPALVSYVLGFIDVAHAESSDAVTVAVNMVAEKLRAESRNDFTTALGHLETRSDTDIKKGLFDLACGDRSSLEKLELSGTVTMMLAQLCEEPSVERTHESTLLPPYASFIKECLNEDGDVIVRWAGNRNEMGDRLRGILIFFSEKTNRFKFTPGQRAQIGAAVLKSLLANGIGVKNPETGSISAVYSASDIGKVPVLWALLQDSANSALASEYNHKVTVGSFHDLPRATPSSAVMSPVDENISEQSSYSLTIGYDVLRWVRNVASHDQNAASTLPRMGLSMPVLDAFARAATAVACNLNDRDGLFFRLNEQGIPELVHVRRQSYRQARRRG